MTVFCRMLKSPRQLFNRATLVESFADDQIAPLAVVLRWIGIRIGRGLRRRDRLLISPAFGGFDYTPG